MRARIPPEMSNYYCYPGRAGGSPQDFSAKTFVFPLNHVGNIDLLASQGYEGFRNAHPIVGRYGRFGNLSCELNVIEAAQEHEYSTSGLVNIPGGYFLNWRHGLRLSIHRAVTLTRWRSILSDAVSRDRVALMYFHPHNLIDGPGTLGLFEGVLRMASTLREAKGLAIVTQAEYCASVLRNVQSNTGYTSVGINCRLDDPASPIHQLQRGS